MPTITVEHVTRMQRRKVILDDLNLSIEDGEYVCLLGETGAGKTTLLYVISGLVHPDKGRILFDGEDVTHISPEDRHVSFVFERFALFPHNSVIQNVIYGRRVRGLDTKEARRIGQQVLDLLHLSGRDSAFPAELSGGMKQRVGIARAFTSGSQILLLDEPMGALDAKIRVELRRELRALVKDLGLTCIHATHDIEEVFQMADRVALMREGKIHAIGTPEDLYKNPRDAETALLIGDANLASGEVVDPNVDGDGAAEIQVHEGIRMIGRRTGLATLPLSEGDPIKAMVRPEHILLSSTQEERRFTPNCFNGRILDSRFLGHKTATWVEIEGILKWKVVALSEIGFTKPEKGGKVRVEISDCVVFPETPEKTERNGQ